MRKKLLSGLLIGTFVFGVGAINDIQPVNAVTPDKVREAKDKYDRARDRFDQVTDGNNSNRPEPPKDENGNPLPPPNFNGDSSNRPEPPKDENGNPIAPPAENK